MALRFSRLAVATFLLLATFSASAAPAEPDLPGTGPQSETGIETRLPDPPQDGPLGDGVGRVLDELEGLIVDPVTGEARLLLGHHRDLPPGVENLLDDFGGRLERVDETLSFAIVHVPKAQVEPFLSAARQVPGVTWAKPDGRLEFQHVPDDSLYDQQWGPPAIGMESAWNTTKGSHNITVSVVDSGIAYDHPDLEENVCVIGPDFGEDDDDPYDTLGHGTHVAGTVGAVIDNAEGVAGMADTCLMAVKISAGDDIITWSDAASGVQWSADNGADVIQMSWGSYQDPGEPLVSAISNAHNAGALLVAAAGNAGCDTDTVGFPAAYPQVVAVAALSPPGDRPAFFSSCGPAVEVSAPGEGILSTVPETVDASGYRVNSGTSMASPHASGVAALLWSEHPGMEAAEIRCILAQSATDLGSEGRDPITGFGRINASAALDTPECTPFPPDAPRIRALSGDESVLLGWDTPHAWGGVDGYHLYRGASPDDLSHLVTLGETNAHEDATADVGETYHYAVVAFNEAGNGTMSDTHEVTPVTALTLPYTEDFEEGLGAWTPDGLWNHGSDRSQSGNHSAYFGIEVGSTPEENTYDTGRREVGDLTSLPIDLRGAQEASLSFWSHHAMEGLWWEHPIVQVATEDAPGRFENVWDIHFDHSGPAALDLTPYAGKVIHLRFHVDTLDAWRNDHEGWYVDDLELTTDPMPHYDPNLEILFPSEDSLSAPAGTLYGGLNDPNGIQDIASGELRSEGGDWKEAALLEFLLLGGYENLTTGDHTFEARITDSAGNTSTDTVTFTVDAEPPQITIDSPPAGELVSCRTIVNGTAVDTGGAGLYRIGLWVGHQWVGGALIGGQDHANWSIPADFAHVQPGTFTLTAMVQDFVGNTNETTIDLERPELDCLPNAEITAPASGSTLGCTSLVQGTASSNQDDVPLAGLYIEMGGILVAWTSLSGESNTTWESTIGTGRFPSGEYILRALVYDQNGNWDYSEPVSVQRDGSDCLPGIDLTNPADGAQEDCVLQASGSLTSPYGAEIAYLYILIDGRITQWLPIDDTNTTFTTDVSIGGLAPGAHELVALAVDEHGIYNQTETRTFERSDALCTPKLEVTAPADGDTVSGRFLLEGTALFPDEGLGVPTDGQLEIILDDETVHVEDLGTGDWSHEVNSWTYEDGALEVLVMLWLDDSNEQDSERLILQVDNEEVSRLEDSRHLGHVGCSAGVLDVRVKDQCATNNTHERETDPGLTAFRLRLDWDEGLTGLDYLSVVVLLGGRSWEATAGPGDTGLVLEAEADEGETFTQQVRDAKIEMHAGRGSAVPAVAVDIDYEIDADWAFFGAELPAS